MVFSRSWRAFGFVPAFRSNTLKLLDPCFFFICFLLFDGKRCESAEKDDFDHQTACKSPVCWSKYTTPAASQKIKLALRLHFQTNNKLPNWLLTNSIPKSWKEESKSFSIVAEICERLFLGSCIMKTIYFYFIKKIW